MKYFFARVRPDLVAQLELLDAVLELRAGGFGRRLLVPQARNGRLHARNQRRDVVGDSGLRALAASVVVASELGVSGAHIRRFLAG